LDIIDNFFIHWDFHYVTMSNLQNIMNSI